MTTLLLPKAVAAGSQLRQPHNRAAAAGSSGRLPTSIRRHRTSLWLCHRRSSIWCRPTWCRRRRRRCHQRHRSSRHRRRRRHRHRGRARGTPIRPCVSRARALSDARRVVEIQQRRGQSRASRFKKIPQPIESLKIWRAVLTCQVLSWTLPLFRSAPKFLGGGMPGGGPGWFAVRSSSGTLTTRPSRGSFSN